jgi:hypothetical protein
MLDSSNMTDSCRFSLEHGAQRLLALTSPSWLLPMKLTLAIFTTGAADGGDHCMVTSAEADLACGIIQMPKAQFA